MAFGPNSFDMLTINGILPYDCNEMITGIPSPYFNPPQLARAAYAPQAPLNTLSQDHYVHSDVPIPAWKKVLAGGFATFLVGALVFRTKNPIEMGKKLFGGAFEKVSTAFKNGWGYVSDKAKKVFVK